MTDTDREPGPGFDDLEWRLSASLHRAAHRADDQQLLGAIATSMARADARVRTDRSATFRQRRWYPILAAVVTVVLVLGVVWWAPRPGTPAQAAHQGESWSAIVTVLMGDKVLGVASGDDSFVVPSGASVRLVVHPVPVQLSFGKTYLEQYTESGWIVAGPHDTDEGGTVVYTRPGPAAGTSVVYRVQIRGAVGYADGWSPSVTLVGG